MKLVSKNSHRGVIGVESSIVLIAFVIVAAALAFVVLNMGFTSTQKAKTTIISGLDEASSSLEVAASVTGVGCQTASCSSAARLNATLIPLKIASGGDSINLDKSTSVIKYIGDSIQYDNIFGGTLTSQTYLNATMAFRAAGLDASITEFSNTTINPVNGTLPSQTTAIIYWGTQSSTNSILDIGETAIMAIAFAESDRPKTGDKVSFEMILPTGATFSVTRIIPAISHIVIDMG